MRVSTKGRYGVRFLMDLAIHGRDGNVTLKQVVRRQGISEKYLWQIASRLKNAGLIRATTGPGGGFALAKPEVRVTLLDILAVLEGDCSLVGCADKPSECSRSRDCGAREIWKEVDEKLAAVLKAITLRDMVEKQRAMAEEPAEFCI